MRGACKSLKMKITRFLKHSTAIKPSMSISIKTQKLKPKDYLKVLFLEDKIYHFNLSATYISPFSHCEKKAVYYLIHLLRGNWLYLDAV